jgi:hypothetical protein
MDGSVQEELAIPVERLELVSRKVHHEERRRLPGAMSPGNRDLSSIPAEMSAVAHVRARTSA